MVSRKPSARRSSEGMLTNKEVLKEARAVRQEWEYVVAVGGLEPPTKGL